MKTSLPGYAVLFLLNFSKRNIQLMLRYLFLQMFQEIMINRSQPNLLRMLSQKSLRAEDIASLLRTPDADRDGATPFLLACLSGNLSMCRYLEQLGADVHAKSLRCA